jgi:hypothetical protein
MQYDFEKRHLYSLGELGDDYEISEGDPDVRGWSLLDREVEKVGVIKDLVVDMRAMKVRYLDVIAVKEIGGGERHLLIPIGAARIDEARDVVKVSELDKGTLTFYPEYTGDVVTRNYEHSIRETLKGKSSFKSDITGEGVYDENFYRNDLYDETGFYYPRRRITTVGGERTTFAYLFGNKEKGTEEKNLKGQSSTKGAYPIFTHRMETLPF